MIDLSANNVLWGYSENGNGPYVKTNFSKVKDLDLIRFEDTIIHYLKEWNIPETAGQAPMIVLVFSTRTCKVAGQFTYMRNPHTIYSSNFPVYGIRLSLMEYNDFGFEASLKTLKHELAHLYCHYNQCDSGHGETFKRICVSMGGHMNGDHAGERYAANRAIVGVNGFYKNHYRYTCPGCRRKWERPRKMSRINERRCLCGMSCKNLVVELINQNA